jgi:hypothetical protein
METAGEDVGCPPRSIRHHQLDHLPNELNAEQHAGRQPAISNTGVGNKNKRDLCTGRHKKRKARGGKKTRRGEAQPHGTLACECPAFPGVYRGGGGADDPAGATTQTARVTRLRYATGSPSRRRYPQRRHARQPAAPPRPRQAEQGVPGGVGGGRSERTAWPRVRASVP